MLVFAVGFVYYPFLKTCLQSVSTVNFRGEITGFAGLENFQYLFSRREFSMALSNTLKLTLIRSFHRISRDGKNMSLFVRKDWMHLLNVSQF